MHGEDFPKEGGLLNVSLSDLVQQFFKLRVFGEFLPALDQYAAILLESLSLRDMGIDWGKYHVFQ